jgi:hypothetical protein
MAEVRVWVEWVSVIDERTTAVCLNVAGKVVHYGCRAMVIPTLEHTFHKATRRQATNELKKRDRKQAVAGGPGPRSTKKRPSLKPRRRR